MLLYSCKHGMNLAVAGRCHNDQARMVTDGYTSLRGFFDLDDMIVSGWVDGRSMHSEPVKQVVSGPPTSRGTPL